MRCYEDASLGLYETGIADSCEFFQLTTGISETSINNFYIIPNPSDDLIQIRLNQGSLQKIQVIDIQGKVMLETDTENVDISQLAIGAYIVRVLMDGRWKQQKLVIN